MMSVFSSDPGPGGGRPAAPRRAATVLVLRPASPEAMPEVLLVRRSRTMAFMADAYVFPGGRVDEADRAAAARTLQGAHEDLGLDALASRLCAARELSEEVGLALPAPIDATTLPLFSRWITPSAEPRRFDTDFFLAALPPDQTPRLDMTEVVDLLWLSPAEAIRRFHEGQLKLPPPTLCNLEDLLAERLRLGEVPGKAEAVVPALLRSVAARPAPPSVLPRLAPEPGTGHPAVILPWDPDFSSFPGEGAPLPMPETPPGPSGVPTPRTRRVVLTPDGWRAS